MAVIKTIITMIQGADIKKRTVKRTIGLLLSFLIFISSFNLKAEEWPVLVSTEITPPYSVYLSDYTNAGVNRLAINLLLKDITAFNYPVKLRLIIEGDGVTVRTSPSYMPSPVILDGGIPLRLDGSELAEYFDPDNLQFTGYSKQQFIQTGALPEGFYRIGFEVWDYNKNIAVSLPGLTFAWLILNDPPIINIPDKNAKLNATEPQNIMFQWMPRHTGSPNSAFTTEYIFEIYEIWPDGRNPNDIVRTSQPLFEKVTYSTSYIYSNTIDPSLIPGKQYAYRVRAHDVQDRDLFRNDGWSEVQMFKYGDPCDAPTMIQSQSNTSGRAALSWLACPYNTEFYVQYRKANQAGAEWFPKTTYLSNLSIDGLEPNTLYEYQVKGVCGTVSSDFSETLTFRTKEKQQTDFSCGKLDSSEIITNTIPCTSLLPGDVITSGKFEVQVTKATNNGGGVWTGEGFAHIPFMGVKLRVTFDRIRLNEKLQLMQGRIVSVYNPDSKYVIHIGDENNTSQGPSSGSPDSLITTENNLTNTLVIDSPIDTILKTPEGEILIISENGDTTRIIQTPEGNTIAVSPAGDTTQIAQGDEITIVDNNGNTTVINSNGDVVSSSGGVSQPQASLSDNPTTIRFFALDNQKYGFDAYDGKFSNLEKYYDSISINGNKYYIPWKSVKSSATDNIGFSIQTQNYTTKKPAVKLTSSVMGTTLPVSPGASDTLKQMQVNGLAFSGKDEIRANYTLSDTSQKEYLGGVLNLVSYPQISKTVKIVSVNNNNIGNITNLEAEVNEIYKQACVNFTFSSEPRLEFSYTDFDASPVKEESFTNDMLALINAFKNKSGSNINPDYYYLFILDRCTEGKKGIMPFLQQFGFIFIDDNTDIEKTVAHELGHGAFGLLHTFKTYGHQEQIPKGQTKNLMDYDDGRRLYKFQWDLVHHPVCYSEVCGEDASSFPANCRQCFLELSQNAAAYTLPATDKQYYTFIAPSGLPISIPKNATNLGFGESLKCTYVGSRGDRFDPCNNSLEIKTDQCLTSFKIGTKLYMAYVEDNSFRGYNYKDPYSKDISSFDILLPKSDGTFTVCSNRTYDITKNVDYYAAGGVSGAGDLNCSAEYNQHINEFASALDNMIINGKYISQDFNFLNEDLLNIYNDKFKVFTNVTKEKDPAKPKNIYVIFKKISVNLDLAEKNAFADAVISKSKNFKKDRMLFLCIPYYWTQEDQAKKQLPSLMLQTVKGYKTDFTYSLKYDQVVSTFYSQVPKPYYCFNYVLLANGDYYYNKVEKANVTGHPVIYDFKLHYDKNIKEIHSLTNKILLHYIATDINNSNPNSSSFVWPNTAYVNSLEDEIKQIQSLSKVPVFESVPVKSRLKESSVYTYHKQYATGVMDYFYRNDFVTSYLDNYFSQTDVPDEHLYLDETKDLAYDALDGLGLVLAPFDLDFITDGIGGIIATVSGDYANAAIYSTASIAQFAPALLLKKGLKFIKYGDELLMVGTPKYKDELIKVLKISDEAANAIKENNKGLRLFVNNDLKNQIAAITNIAERDKLVKTILNNDRLLGHVDICPEIAGNVAKILNNGADPAKVSKILDVVLSLEPAKKSLILSKIDNLPSGSVNKFADDLSLIKQQNPDFLSKLESNPGLVDSWKSFRIAGLDDLANNTTQLEKFDALVRSNNLGLDAKGLEDILKLPSTKMDGATGLPLKWDNPDKVLDAVKRASDVNISGLTIGHKKFPAPSSGTDNFVLKNAKQYQAEASMDAGLSFEKGGVSFDNVASDGKLVDRKYGHGTSIFDEDGGVINNTRAESILKQADRQLKAVGGDGSKLRWEISTPEGASGIEDLFLNNSNLYPGIEDIEVVHVVQNKIVK